MSGRQMGSGIVVSSVYYGTQRKCECAVPGRLGVGVGELFNLKSLNYQ